MMTVRLETESGELVTYASIPPFNTMPAVLVWGIRHFKLSDSVFRHTERQGERLKQQDLAIYRECFAVAIIDESTPRPQP